MLNCSATVYNNLKAFQPSVERFVSGVVLVGMGCPSFYSLLIPSVTPKNTQFSSVDDLHSTEA
jgi:hypothetical protein